MTQCIVAMLVTDFDCEMAVTLTPSTYPLQSPVVLCRPSMKTVILCRTDLISACTNLQDLMLLLQVVFPLSQPGQRLPRLLQAVLPAYQLQDCKGGQLVVKGCMNVMETSDFMETGKSETCNGNNFSGR